MNTKIFQIRDNYKQVGEKIQKSLVNNTRFFKAAEHTNRALKNFACFAKNIEQTDIAVKPIANLEKSNEKVKRNRNFVKIIEQAGRAVEQNNSTLINTVHFLRNAEEINSTAKSFINFVNNYANPCIKNIESLGRTVTSFFKNTQDIYGGFEKSFPIFKNTDIRPEDVWLLEVEQIIDEELGKDQRANIKYLNLPIWAQVLIINNKIQPYKDPFGVAKYKCLVSPYIIYQVWQEYLKETIQITFQIFCGFFVDKDEKHLNWKNIKTNSRSIGFNLVTGKLEKDLSRTYSRRYWQGIKDRINIYIVSKSLESPKTKKWIFIAMLIKLGVIEPDKKYGSTKYKCIVKHCALHNLWKYYAEINGVQFGYLYDDFIDKDGKKLNLSNIRKNATKCKGLILP